MLKRFLNSYIFLVIILLGVSFISYQLVEITYEKSRIKEKLPPLKQEIKEMGQKREELASMMEYYKTESYLEKEARSKLNLKKEGEEVVVVLPPKKIEQVKKEGAEILNSQSIDKKEDSEHKKNPTNPRLWWQYFFK